MSQRLFIRTQGIVDKFQCPNKECENIIDIPEPTNIHGNRRHFSSTQKIICSSCKEEITLQYRGA